MDKEIKTYSREEKIFLQTPIWKLMLKMISSSLILVICYGSYTFVDHILSINLAHSNYEELASISYTSKDLVRIFMTACSPIITFIFAITILFSIGATKRYSINLGSNNKTKAVQIIHTTLNLGLIVSLVFIPILLFLAKPIIKLQFAASPAYAQIIADNSFEYIWIIILTFPFQMIIQIIGSLLRSEARNRQIILAVFIPLLINLFFDYLFMHTFGLGLKGGAWATFISYFLSAAFMIFFTIINKNSNITFKNLFNFQNFRFILIFSVIFMGISVFIRNFFSSFMQTWEVLEIQKVSKAIYNDSLLAPSIFAAIIPIFNLFLPIMFGFVDASIPIASFNYGAKKIKRVKTTIFYLCLFSFVTFFFIYIFLFFILLDPLFRILGIKEFQQSMKSEEAIPLLYKAKIIYLILFSSTFFLPIFFASTALFESTDRVFLSISASFIYSFLFFVPFVLIFSQIAQGQSHTEDIIKQNLYQKNSIFSSEFIFWWFYPCFSFLIMIIFIPISIYVFKTLEKKHDTFENKIEKLNLWIKKRFY